MKRIHGSLINLSLPCLLAALAACKGAPDYSRALPEGAPALIALERGDQVPDFSQQWETRDEILPALERSLDWTRRAHARGFFPVANITHERALASLEHFEALLHETSGPEEFQRRIVEDFTIYKSAGWDGRGGGVLFTAYCTPILSGSLTADGRHSYPLYALPPDLVKAPNGDVLGWDTNMGLFPNYPSRGAIEAGALLEERGLELVYLEDPIDAYIAHVNGSAFIELADGTLYRLGYAGKNGRPYSSLGRELEEDGILKRGEASLRSIRDWAARASDEEIQDYLGRNASYVFFTPIDGNPHGSLDVEVTSGRSLATDKTLFPRGALVFIDTTRAENARGTLRRFLFDQDTGGAIRTAGRADVYLGIGPEAEGEAGYIKDEGQLYYLFLKEGS